MTRSFILRSVIFVALFIMAGQALYKSYFSSSEATIVSDLAGTNGRNTQSVPSNSILPSSPSVVVDVLFGSNDDTNQIMIAQLILRSQNLYSGETNGRMNFETQVSLFRFQSKNGLSLTGDLTPNTYELLLKND